MAALSWFGLLWLSTAHAADGSVRIVLAPGSVASAVELVCGELYRERVSVSDGEATFVDVPASQMRTAYFKGGPPGGWQAIRPGAVLRCTIGPERVRCESIGPGEGRVAKPTVPAVGRGTAPQPPPATAPVVQEPVPPAPSSTGPLTVVMEGGAVAGMRLVCADGWTIELQRANGRYVVPTVPLESCTLVVSPAAAPPVPVSGGGDLRCTLEPARLRCGG